jgi:acyl-CoA thioesterase II
MLATLTELLNLLDLTEIGDGMFEGSQPDPPNHHIVGGQIAAQALIAASKTVAGWAAAQPAPVLPEARRRSVSVHFDASGLRDGGTFSARRVSAAQDGEVLMMEAIASFTGDVDNVDYQDGMPDAAAPETLVRVGSS